MSTLAATLLEVGWGDSILIESTDDKGTTRYALIDSNDETPDKRIALWYLRRHFQTNHVSIPTHLFEFIMVSHGHSDHISGIRKLIEEFGAKKFYYPKSNGSGFGDLIRYVKRSVKHPAGRVKAQIWLDNTKSIPALGDATIEVLWPPPSGGTSPYDTANPNNNSLVIRLRLGAVEFMVTGDCEASEWPSIIPHINAKQLMMFKVPHHGARNGTFDGIGNTPWLDSLQKHTGLAISTHISPHQHPDKDVIDELDARSMTLYRTDEHYHLRFETDGKKTTVKWSRV